MLITRTFKSSLLQRWSAHLWQNGMTSLWNYNPRMGVMRYKSHLQNWQLRLFFSKGNNERRPQHWSSKPWMPPTLWQGGFCAFFRKCFFGGFLAARGKYYIFSVDPNYVRQTIAAIKSYQLTQIKLKLKFIDLSFAPSLFYHGITCL